MFTVYPPSRELEEDTEQKDCKKLRIPPIVKDKIMQHVGWKASMLSL